MDNGEQEKDQALPPDAGAASGLVVIGASAGGIDALLTLVGALPPDFPIPIVIAQHLDPHRRSRLREILANRSNLPVREANDFEPLLPGAVYVVPADRDVEISDHHIGLRQDGVSRSQPSIDLLMGTAARVFGDTLIGVILTGAGMDGTAGARAIKAHGGTVIVQNPRSARFSGMPSSISTSTIDIVAELDAIEPLLVELSSGVYPSSSDDGQDDLASFLNRVRDLSGVDFSAYKQPTIERRLQRRMVAVGVGTLAEYRRYVDRHPEELQRLVTTFLIKVTQFFRDPELFAYLQDKVIPHLIEEARRRGELRLWSAGCATGEEAYTLAMLVADALGDELPDLPVRIFATDVASDAVEFARHGVYAESAVAELPDDLVERHFIRRDGAYEVRKHIRGMIVFGEHDLSRRAPFPRIDLVLCRNVLIYFSPQLQRRSLQLFAFSLRPGGYLALGKSETVTPLPEYFAVEQPRVKVFQRIGAAAQIPPDRLFDALPVIQTETPTARPKPPRERTAPVMVPPPASPLIQPARTLEMLGGGVALIDRDYHILSINTSARRLLGIVAAGPGEDVIHRAVPALAQSLRAALDTAFRGETYSAAHRVPGDVVDDGGRDLVITCTPSPADAGNERVDAVVLEVTDVTPFAQRARDLGGELDQATDERDTLRTRVSDATVEVRELRAASQSMVVELDRLRSENEQLQLASEEAQAATEEIETLNEEQQATNEELETLNEELQATVEELNTTNADLQARAVELESLAAILDRQRADSELERSRLQVILNSMSEAVMLLDAHAEVVLVNPAWVAVFGAGGELVPEDELGRALPPEVWPRRRVLEDEPSMLQFTSVGSDGRRRWFEANIQPIRGDDGSRWGVVVIRDITDRSLRQLQQQFLTLASHELRTPLTTLSGSLQLLARRLGSSQNPAQLERHVSLAREQVRRLEEHIGELTDVVHLQTGIFRVELAPVDLVTVVGNALELAQYLPNAQEVRGDLPDPPVLVDGDSRRLEQVLLNLLVNAFRHAPGTAAVDVRLRTEDDDALIVVQDYGPGIPAGAQADIFTQFYRGEREGPNEERATTRAGLGLGLFIAREIVLAHGGTIVVESEEGKGATFTVRLPLRRDDPASRGAGLDGEA